MGPVHDVLEHAISITKNRMFMKLPQAYGKLALQNCVQHVETFCQVIQRRLVFPETKLAPAKWMVGSDDPAFF